MEQPYGLLMAVRHYFRYEEVVIIDLKIVLLKAKNRYIRGSFFSAIKRPPLEFKDIDDK